MKSAIYTVMTSPRDVAVGGVIPLGTTNHRMGKNLFQMGDTIVVRGAGLYDVKASITVEATAAGLISATLYQDGVPVPGAVSAETKGAAGDDATLVIIAGIRTECCKSSRLTLVIGGTEATVTNVSMAVTQQ